jgi:RND family efflux transporter MFP subunit
MPSKVFARLLCLPVLLACFAPCPALGQAARKDVLTVKAEKPHVESWPLSIPAGGWLTPWHEAVVASEIGGLKIVELRAEVGDHVTRGQVLAVLEHDTTLAELRERQAAFQAAQADFNLAQANGDRARKLVETGSFTRQQYEQEVFTEESTAARLAMAEAALEVQRLRLEKTVIPAVDDGFISSRSASFGQVVSTGTELFRLVRQGRVEWLAEIAVNQARQVKSGQTAILAGPGGREVEGEVLFVEPMIKKESARAIVHVALKDDPDLKCGGYISGSLLIAASPAVTVPESAVVWRDGFSYVFTLKPGDVVARVKVETGRRLAGRVEVMGLEDAALVVRSGGAFLADNDPVKVVADGESS